ncbi:hypothetical protein ZWY2020_023846 [Hordeum vulgare]|nr:hypothetical protein ZWY2020_023846 [Hordeum vulgare]
MASAGFLAGFLLGLLALAAAAALLWVARRLRRRGEGAAAAPDAHELPGEQPFPYEKKGCLWILEPEKLPKVSNERLSSGGPKETKEKKSIVEVFPAKKSAQIKGHSLCLSGPDGPDTTIKLLNCTVVAVSASSMSSRKWTKRYPIKLESQESEIYNGSKVCFLYAETSWEKESWCKALRLAATTDKKKLNWHAKLSKEFGNYISSLNSEYPCFLKPTAISAEDHEVMDSEIKQTGLPKSVFSSKASKEKASTKVHFVGTVYPLGYFGAQMSVEINKAIKGRIQRTLSSMRTPAYVGEITLTEFSLGKLPPYVHAMRVLPLDLNELWAFEVDFEYSGGILLDIETRLEVEEPELQKDLMKTNFGTDSNGEVDSELLESIEQYGNQFRGSQNSVSSVEEKDEADASQSKNTGWTSTYISRLKNMLHSIAIMSHRFSSVITVLPNCECISLPGMLAEKDDWVPRKEGPYIWLNHEPVEAKSHVAAATPTHPEEAGPKDDAISKSTTPSLPASSAGARVTEIHCESAETLLPEASQARSQVADTTSPPHPDATEELRAAAGHGEALGGRHFGEQCGLPAVHLPEGHHTRGGAAAAAGGGGSSGLCWR